MRHKHGRQWVQDAAATPHRPVGHNAVELRDAAPILAKVPAKGRAVKGTVPVTSPQSSNFRKGGTEWGHGLRATLE